MMFDFLKRSELVRRGLASGKTRRRRTRAAFSRAIEYSLTMKLVLFAGFVLGLGLLIFSGHQAEPTKNFSFALLSFLIALMFRWLIKPRPFSKVSAFLLSFASCWFNW